jgi:23S rRNA maturation mini-RNase III
MKNQIVWKLESKIKNEKTNENVYTYTDSANRFFQLEPHSTKAFSYYTKASKDVSNKEQSKILDTYIENAMNQDEYKGGYNEAIQTLIVNN